MIYSGVCISIRLLSFKKQKAAGLGEMSGDVLPAAPLPPCLGMWVRDCGTLLHVQLTYVVEGWGM